MVFPEFYLNYIILWVGRGEEGTSGSSSLNPNDLSVEDKTITTCPGSIVQQLLCVDRDDLNSVLNQDPD